MSRLYPPKHGREHRPGGSDPIPITAEGLQYNTATAYGPLNAGDWLDVQTTNNGSGAPTGAAVAFHGVGGFVVTDNSDVQIFLSQLGNGGVNLQDSGSGGINISTFGTSGISLFDDTNSGISQIAAANGGILLLDRGSGGILIQGHASGNVVVQNDGSGSVDVNSLGGVTIEDNSSVGLAVTQDGSGGITISNTHANNGVIEILGTSANQPNPRLVIHSPTSSSGDNLFIGDDSRGILFSGGTAPHVQINGGNPSSSSQLSYNIILDAGADTTGSYATNYKNVGVRVTPTLIFGSTDTAPTGSVLGSDTYTSVLFVHADGTGHPKLKFYCPLTGTTTTIATG